MKKLILHTSYKVIKLVLGGGVGGFVFVLCWVFLLFRFFLCSFFLFVYPLFITLLVYACGWLSIWLTALEFDNLITLPVMDQDMASQS